MEDTKADIFNCAKELFSTKGYKDTNISDITKKVGIGTGTFYKYYASKDELFLEIYLKENEELKKSIMKSVKLDGDPIKIVQEIIANNLDGMRSNPILKEWYNRDLFSKLEKEFYKLGGIKRINELMNGSLMEIIKAWKAQGKLRDDIDDDMILAIFSSIPYIDIHKEELGIQYFPRILEYLEEFIMKGLTDCRQK
ncbi:TetR/AcrR family transcriptional regulator [Geosporobacter ferrireducens]|uniref:Transcriptional regulator n=1 Tax=Geosporobacter ferrireducens TaxID=1424294 RepID=A0A1D8GET0_9FIRM|nr:TetR/AcrR family transcriptional regulator [Geosporobacter ferrireducens]AOT69403.1 transcriptional regulator [Geosporobacter ferrireducens]MTI56513.1 TetR/AcrR family transcriptional regulator [Geosporobacter ferrireducens]